MRCAALPGRQGVEASRPLQSRRRALAPPEPLRACRVARLRQDGGGRRPALQLRRTAAEGLHGGVRLRDGADAVARYGAVPPLPDGVLGSGVMGTVRVFRLAATRSGARLSRAPLRVAAKRKTRT